MCFILFHFGNTKDIQFSTLPILQENEWIFKWFCHFKNILYVKSIFVTLKIIQNILFNECKLSELFQFLLAIFDLLPPVVGLFRFGALYVIVISQNFVQTVSVPRLEGFSNICSQLWCQSMWTRRYDLEICQEKLSKTQYIY